MITVIVNSKFEYKVPNLINFKANIKETQYRDLLIQSLKNGNDGISNVKCPVSGQTLFMVASNKLKMKYDLHFEIDEDMSEQDIENEDNLNFKF